MDLLTALPPQLPLIIPSTTIREVRHRSLPLHNRLQQLVQDEDRSVWVWWNEECRDTATAAAGEEDEVVNDRNDRAIRETLRYYPEHIAQSVAAGPQLILLTDDKRNRELAASEDLVAVSTRDYVDGLQGDVRDRLVDLVAGGVDDLEPGERKSRRVYDDVSNERTAVADPKYLPQDMLNAGVKSGRFLQGYFNANQYNYLEVSYRYPLIR